LKVENIFQNTTGQRKINKPVLKKRAFLRTLIIYHTFLPLPMPTFEAQQSIEPLILEVSKRLGVTFLDCCCRSTKNRNNSARENGVPCMSQM
jgi:hypothetical protein